MALANPADAAANGAVVIHVRYRPEEGGTVPEYQRCGTVRADVRRSAGLAV
jgi:hypothetical protein